MIVRSAYLEGSVPEADRDRFDRHMGGPVLAAIATYPRIREVKLRRIEQADAAAPPVYMVFDLYFDSVADMEAALASPVRQAVRGKIIEGMALFTGRVYHLVFSQD